jgi:cysteine-rich repeat protein
MKFIYAVCLLVLLPATASAAEPKWRFRKADNRSNPRDVAVVTWPNPQYRGELTIKASCRTAGSQGLSIVMETGEHLGSAFDTLEVPLNFGGERVVMAMTASNSILIPSGYDNQVRFVDALLSPPFSLAIADVDGRPVVATSVPTEGAETALRKLTCLSRYFYEYDQRPKEEAEPEAPVVPAAPAAPANRCGDGHIQEEEVCDEGRANGRGLCSADCKVQNWSRYCGDAVQQAGEGCDDGNHLSNDTCEPDCTLPVRNGGVRP